MIQEVTNMIGDIRKRETGINLVCVLKESETLRLDLLVMRKDGYTKGKVLRCYYCKEGEPNIGMGRYYKDRVQELLDLDFKNR